MPDAGQEGILINSSGHRLLGTLFTAWNEGPNPTVLLLHGMPGIELNYDIALALREHGWNCLIFEGPGQRGAIHLDPSLTLRHDWEVPVKAVVDYALTLPEVDADKLALIGYSLGGYLAPRAVAFEHRIKACVASSLLIDIGQAFRAVYPRIIRNSEKRFNFL